MGLMVAKRGYYFSIDALLASALIMAGLVLASSMYVHESKTTRLLHYSQDIQDILSNIKLSELNSSLVSSWYAAGIITDLNRTVIDQAGEFWALGNASLAVQLLNITTIIIPSQLNGVFYDDELVYGSSAHASSALVSSKRLVSGIAKGSPAEGFSSNARLTSFQARNSYSYAYFGGFTGQGNMTFRLDLPSSLFNVTNASLELDPSDNFSVFINDKFSGYYLKGSAGGGNMSADKWVLNSSYLKNFVAGTNFINMTFNRSLGYIGGGFLRVTYTTSTANESGVKLGNGSATDRYYFPGIDGLINLYDSFFIPGSLSTLTAHLHYNSSFNTFLTIGNSTVFSLNSSGVQVIDLTDGNLGSKLNYAALSSTTVPVRLGSGSGSGNSTIIGTGNADVVLANDLSGSMEYCSNNPCALDCQDFPPNGAPPQQGYCVGKYKPEFSTYCNKTAENYTLSSGLNVCSGRCHANCSPGDTRKIDIAINASKQFATTLLGTPGNQMGVVGYTSIGANFEVYKSDGTSIDPFPDSIVSYVNLTSNAPTIINNIDNFMDTFFESCLCCGITKAEQILNNDSTPGRAKSIVVMTDGAPTNKCGGAQGSEVSAWNEVIPIAQAICASSNISISTVAFGADANSNGRPDKLKEMVCGGGAFYNATNLTELIKIYNSIANNITKVSYKEQVINFSGGVAQESLLYGDSYIEYNYTPDVISAFGVIPATLETPRFGNNISSTTLTIPVGSTLYQVKVTSYSSDKWTDNLTISNSVPNRQAFSLGQFGNNYALIGDPFVVYAKSNLFETGSNVVKISTATSGGNYSGGSPDDVIIYTLLVPNSVPNGAAFAKADGCVWHVAFEDGTNTTVPIPSGYSGSESCDFNPAKYTANDSMDDAVYRLLKNLDFDGDGLLDIKFQSSDLGVGISTLSSVPSLWGPTVAEVRVWQ